MVINKIAKHAQNVDICHEGKFYRNLDKIYFASRLYFLIKKNIYFEAVNQFSYKKTR